MHAKLRRHIDLRTASFAKEVAQHAHRDPRLRPSVLSVALTGFGVVNQMQQLAAACRNAQQAFEVVFPEDSDAREHASELFDNLARVVLSAAEGALTEAIEILVVVAIQTLESENDVRLLSSQAHAYALDTADIAVDDQDVPRPSRAEESQEPDQAYCLRSSQDKLRVAAVAEVAISRKLSTITVEADANNLVLVGWDTRRARGDRLCRLDCDPDEARRIQVAVARKIHSAGVQ